MVVWCTQNAPRWQQFLVAPAMPALYVHHFGGYSKTRYRKLVTHVESHPSAEPARERRIAIQKRSTNKQVSRFGWHVFEVISLVKLQNKQQLNGEKR